MRLAHTFNSAARPHESPQQSQAAPHADRSEDALASACLFGIVGGLLFGVAIVPTVSAVLVGAALGALVGVIIAYH